MKSAWLAASAAIAAMVGMAPVPSVAAASRQPSVDWVSCAPQEVQDGVECGSITVPIDWSHPTSDTVQVRVYRLKATDQTALKGTIASLPAGPGSTGDLAFATLRRAAPSYDLISLDPRGVGSSSPLNCEFDSNLVVPPFVPPVTEAGLSELRASQERWRSACTMTPAPALQHLDATSVAHDLDYLRQALQLPQINIHGHSYGTLLGEKYLARFGRHVRASILEGVLDPTQDRRQFLTTAAAASQAAFEEFKRWCDAETTCALHGQDPAAVLHRAQANADTNAIPGTYGGWKWSAATVINLFEIEAMTIGWSSLATKLAQLARNEDPTPDDENPDSSHQPTIFNYAEPIVCQDFPLAVRSIDDAAGDLAAQRRAAPAVGYNTNSSQYASTCVGWPGPAPGTGGAVSSQSSHTTLLVSNSHDIATPVNWAQSVERQLGDKATLLTVDRVSHGGGTDAPGCAQKIILEYLDTLATPAPGTRCPAPTAN